MKMDLFLPINYKRIVYQVASVVLQRVCCSVHCKCWQFRAKGDRYQPGSGHREGVVCMRPLRLVLVLVLR
jgi:hypothetical protein